MKKSLISIKPTVISISFILILSIVFSMTVMANALPPGYSPTVEIITEAPPPLTNIDFPGAGDDEVIPDATVPLGNPDLNKTPPITGDSVFMLVMLTLVSLSAVGTVIFVAKRKTKVN